MTAWIDAEADADVLADLWPDSSSCSEDTLDVLLGAAQEQCEEYAGDVDEPQNRHKQAVILQARANFEASRRENGGPEYPITTQPMDRTIMLLLRPRKGVRTVL